MSQVPITLADRLTEQERQERRRAVRALLLRPLLTATADPEALVLVKRHAAWLRDWFAHYPGWPLHVEAELARLHKRPVDTRDQTRPAWVKPGEPFSRRRYVLLCLCLAALERMDRQTTLHAVAQAVVQLVAEDPALGEAGIEFTLKGRAQRRDLVVAVRYLMDWNVLARIHGSEERFLSEQGDALYQIDRAVLSRLLDTHAPPSLVETEDHEARLAALLEARLDGPEPAGDEVRRQLLRHRVCRRLLDDPVLYYDDLDAEMRDYVQRSRGMLLAALQEATGLHAEVRAEGIALADEWGTLTDVRLPEEGTEGHVTLLVADYLAGVRAAGAVGGTGGTAAGVGRAGEDVRARVPEVGRDEVVAFVAEQIKIYGRYWRKAAREPGAEQGLARLALERMEALGLVQIRGDRVEPRPAVARYRLMEPRLGGGQ